MDAVNDILENYDKVRRTGIIRGLHMTRDYYMRLLADRDLARIAAVYDTNVRAGGAVPVFGFVPVIHNEPCDLPYWFDVDLFFSAL